MTNEFKSRILKSREHYAADHALVVQQVTDDEQITLQIRRIKAPYADGREELQIEINIQKRGMKRNQSMFSSFICSPEIADAIAKACKDIKYDQ